MKVLKSFKGFSAAFLTGMMITALTITPQSGQITYAKSSNEAPGSPGVSSAWTTGAKNGVGTAFYDPASGKSTSNVWYTLTNGILSEVYYPDVTRANLQELQFAVTDGKTFVDFEKEDTNHEIQLVKNNALEYKQINTDKEKKYKIEKTYITDPSQNTVLTQVSFSALKGNVKDYKLMLYANPSINNSGMADSAKVLSKGGAVSLVSSEGNTAMAVTASQPFLKATSGFAGTSDGIKELKEHFDLVNTYTSAQNGNVAQMAEIDLGKGSGKKSTFTVAIGFGETDNEAVKSTLLSLRLPFPALEESYSKGWKEYIKTLSKPIAGDTAQYNVAAMALKAHEDKLHPGAMIASLTVPWGEAVNADQGGVGGYHLVWSRDLYEVASSLAVIGDQDTAQRALDYLDYVQQKPDGSFPQNSWLDGSPYWGGLQMDEVAYPIILAHQLGDTGESRYQSLIKPAADFIVKNGPSTPQERWEEEGGYSPSTIAAEIAALVTAGKAAKDHNDLGSAAVYFSKADEWEKKIEDWTVTKKAPLTSGKQPYYFRVNDNTDPDDGHNLQINNGGGDYPENEIVDAGFLELVRLGIRSADDPLIAKSLDVIDKAIKYDSLHGPVWYRYNHDGYGEKANAGPYDGTGVGRPWPFLSGERGQYEIELGLTAKKNKPSNMYGPTQLLKTMEGTANDGCLIPEQIWDGQALPERSLMPGEGTGSATPLAWSMAEYLRLSEDIKQGKTVEKPQVVTDRYLDHRPAQGPEITIDSPKNGTEVTQPHVTITGSSTPNTTIVLSGGKERTVVTTNAEGRFSAEIELAALGMNVIDVISYDNQRSVNTASIHVNYKLPAFLDIADPAGDDYGPGSYVYPTDPVFKKGDFDIQHVRASMDSTNVYFEVQVGNIDNPWGGPSGLSKQMLDIYIDEDGKMDSGNSWIKDLNAVFRPDAGWEKRIRVTGNWQGNTGVYDNYDSTPKTPIGVKVDESTRTIVLTVPKSALGGEPQPGWGFSFLLAGENNGGVREVHEHTEQWNFGGGSGSNQHSHIIDMTVPQGETQENVLDWTKGSPVQLPTIRITK